MQVVIVGGGKVGSHLARALGEKGHELTVIEINPDRCQLLEEFMSNTRVICGDGDEPYVLDDANARNADAVIAATGHDEDNLVVCLLAKAEYHVPLTIARINNPDNEWLFGERFGVDVAVSTAGVIEGLVEKEVSLGDIITLMKLQTEELVLDQVKLPADSEVVGKSIAELGLPACTQVVAIISAGQVEVPRGATVLKADDELLFLAKCEDERELQRIFGVLP